MLNLDCFSHPILKKSNTLIKARIWMYGSSLIHLMFISSWLLSIDFTKAEDPSLHAYDKIRWKLITTWFNLLNFAYLPACIYCDWRELRGESPRHVVLLNKARDLVFTSLLLPTTAFGDILFWRIWNMDKYLIAPQAMDAFVPFWCQHCMHTVSLLVVLLDLLMVPRQRPKNMTLGISLLTAFMTAYIFVCFHSCLNGEYVYQGLRICTGHKLIVLIAYCYLENFFYYTSQFLIVDMVWGTKRVKKLS